MKNKIASNPDREHQITCAECKDMHKEDQYLQAYRKVMREDMGEVLANYLSLHENITEKVNDLHDQNIPVVIKKRTIYLAPLAGVISIIALIIMAISHFIQK